MLWVDDVVITLFCIPLPHHSVLHPASEKGGRTRKREKGWDRGRVSEERGGGKETWIEWNGGLSEMPDWFQMNLLTTTVPGHIQPLWLTVGAGSSLLPLYQTVIFLPFPVQNTFRFEKYFGSLLPKISWQFWVRYVTPETFDFLFSALTFVSLQCHFGSAVSHLSNPGERFIAQRGSSLKALET